MKRTTAEVATGRAEVKILLLESEVQKVIRGHRLRLEEAVSRDVYFFDTPDFALAEGGLVLRARKTLRRPDDATVKLRPMKRADIARRWLATLGFKSEIDLVGGRPIESCSLTHAVHEGKIDQTVLTEAPIRSLFTPAQRDFVRQHAGVRPEWSAVRAFGPVLVRVWKLGVRGLREPVTVELWRLPNDQRLIEFSSKTSASEAPEVRARLEKFVGDGGFHPDRGGDSKTRLALRFFKGDRAT